MIQSSGIIVVDNFTVLCVRSYKNWDFPKGKLSKSETAIDAAKRELCEETSLCEKDIEILSTKSFEPIIYGKGSRKKTATYFVAKRISNKEPFLPYVERLKRRENDEYRWVHIDDLYDLMPKRLYPVINDLVKYFEENLTNES